MADEKRLIDKDALLEQLEREWPTITDIDDYYYIVKDLPTVDAVEVVRCKDCKHYENDALWCNKNSYAFGEGYHNWYEDDFCSYGERR